jgi:hypothetical protein
MSNDPTIPSDSNEPIDLTDEWLLPAKPATKTPPWWAWLFAAVCGAVPIVALGGWVPAMIGVCGATGCIRVGTRLRHSPLAGFILCLLMSIASWTLFGLLILVIFLARGGNPVEVARRSWSMARMLNNRTAKGTRR